MLSWPNSATGSCMSGQCGGYYLYCLSVIMAESIRQPDELVLAGNITENWRKCKQEFELYLVATGLDTNTSRQKIALLLHVARKQAI